jgi:hypothetical protein
MFRTKERKQQPLPQKTKTKHGTAKLTGNMMKDDLVTSLWVETDWTAASQ